MKYKSQKISDNLYNYQIDNPIFNQNKNIQFVITYNNSYFIASRKLLTESEIKEINLNEYDYKPLNECV